jgi:hypothetical protein
MKSRYVLPTTAALITLVLASCGGSKSTPVTEAPTTAAPVVTDAPTTTEAPTTAAPTTEAPTTEAPVVTIADIPAAHTEIVANWEKFFDNKTVIADRIPLLENSDKLAETITQAVASPMLKQVTAKVTAVAFESETRALVTYDILLNGAAAMSGSQGVAVLVDGKWLVSQESFCALVALGGVTVGCE